VEALGDHLTYQWLFNGTNLSGQSGRLLVLSSLRTNQSGLYSVRVSNTLEVVESSTTPLRVITASQLSPELGNAVDAPALGWYVLGASFWFNETNVTHDGIDAAQVGWTPNEKQTSLYAQVAGPGTLAFWWKASTEPLWDNCYLFVDNQPRTRISGLTDWIHEQVPIAAAHTRWRGLMHLTRMSLKTRTAFGSMKFIHARPLCRSVPCRRARRHQFDLDDRRRRRVGWRGGSDAG